MRHISAMLPYRQVRTHRCLPIVIRHLPAETWIMEVCGNSSLYSCAMLMHLSATGCSEDNAETIGTSLLEVT